MAEVAQHQTQTQEYFQALEDYNDNQVSIPESRFQDLEGNYIYQDRKTQLWTLIHPPKYLRTPQRKQKLQTKKHVVNAQLQFDRNNIALTSPEDKDDLKEQVKEYNEGCEKLTEVDTKLKAFSKVEDAQLNELKAQVAKLEAENDKILRTEVVGTKIVNSGQLPDLEEKIKDVHARIMALIPQVYPNPSERPQRIYEINPNTIPATESGAALKLSLEQWSDLNDEYKDLNVQYNNNLKEIEKLQAQITSLELSLFRLGFGKDPGVKQITAGEVAVRRQAITKSTEPKPEAVEEKPGVEEKPKRVRIIRRKPLAPSVVCLKGKQGIYGKGLEKAPQVLYVGRAMNMGGWRLKKSKWHNPFKVSDPQFGGDIQKVLEAYRAYMYEPAQRSLLEELPELTGKVLACWCDPEPCHGSVLAELFKKHVIDKEPLPGVIAQPVPAPVIAPPVGVPAPVQPQVAAEIPPKPAEEQRKIIIRRIYKKDPKKCPKGPKAGGYSWPELKKMAQEAGIPIEGRKKAEVCADIQKLLNI